MSKSVWFWQRIVSPHMAGVAAALANDGIETTYVVEQLMSKERADQGWNVPNLGSARLLIAENKTAAIEIANKAPSDSIHICQGLRENGLVGFAQQVLSRRGLIQWIVMETVEEGGWKGHLRKIVYRHLIHRRRNEITGYLVAGHAMPTWLASQGVREEDIYPFAYFLMKNVVRHPPLFDAFKPFQILFVGQIVPRKDLALLIEALRAIDAKTFELVVIGSGPLEIFLKNISTEHLGGSVVWLGKQPQDAVPDYMAAADCLVLPSKHDGWGAVVSEALMNGTPAICSDRCGVADIVRNSGTGGVFSTGDVNALTYLLRKAISNGRQTPQKRLKLSNWSNCLSAPTGAKYLKEIIMPHGVDTVKPVSPWV